MNVLIKRRGEREAKAAGKRATDPRGQQSRPSEHVVNKGGGMG